MVLRPGTALQKNLRCVFTAGFVGISFNKQQILLSLIPPEIKVAKSLNVKRNSNETCGKYTPQVFL